MRQMRLCMHVIVSGFWIQKIKVFFYPCVCETHTSSVWAWCHSHLGRHKPRTVWVRYHSLLGVDIYREWPGCTVVSTMFRFRHVEKSISAILKEHCFLLCSFNLTRNRTNRYGHLLRRIKKNYKHTSTPRAEHYNISDCNKMIAGALSENSQYAAACIVQLSDRVDSFKRPSRDLSS